MTNTAIVYNMINIKEEKYTKITSTNVLRRRKWQMLCVHSPHGSTLLRGQHLENVTSNPIPSNDAYCQISSWSDLKRRDLRLFWKRSSQQEEEQQTEEEQDQQDEQRYEISSWSKTYWYLVTEHLINETKSRRNDDSCRQAENESLS